jgi:hypothetical protein
VGLQPVALPHAQGWRGECANNRDQFGERRRARIIECLEVVRLGQPAQAGHVAALYVTQASTDASAILEAPTAKQLVLHFVRNVGRSDLNKAWELRSVSKYVSIVEGDTPARRLTQPRSLLTNWARAFLRRIGPTRSRVLKWAPRDICPRLTVLPAHRVPDRRQNLRVKVVVGHGRPISDGNGTRRDVDDYVLDVLPRSDQSVQTIGKVFIFPQCGHS